MLTSYVARCCLSLVFVCASAALGATPEQQQILSETARIHGEAGPWAVVGYRMGQRALHDLKLSKNSFSMKIVHQTPHEVQYSCIADGLQAATGASAGKLNLTLETVPVDKLATVIDNPLTRDRLVFHVAPGFAAKYLNVPDDQLSAVGAIVAALPDDEIFTVTRQTLPKS